MALALLVLSDHSLWEASCHLIAGCPHGEQLRPPANSRQGIRAFCYQPLEWACRQILQPQASFLMMRSWLTTRLQPHETPWAKPPAKPLLKSCLTVLRDNKRFGVTRDTARDNKDMWVEWDFAYCALVPPESEWGQLGWPGSAQRAGVRSSCAFLRWVKVERAWD